MWLLQADLTKPFVLPPQFHGREVAFVSAFPPCYHLAISGARWFKGKGPRALARSIDMFATAAEFCESGSAPYFIENPVSTISTYWRDSDYKFHPHWFTGWEPKDNYNKLPCLWVGNGFIMPSPYKQAGITPPDNRIHAAPDSKGRSDFRNATPLGWAHAVYHAQKSN